MLETQEYRTLVHIGDIDKGTRVVRRPSLMDDSESLGYRPVGKSNAHYEYFQANEVEPIESPLPKSSVKQDRLRIGSNNEVTSVWIDGVELRDVKSVIFGHVVNETPTCTVEFNI